MSKIVDFFMQNARTIGIVYVVGAVVVFLAMTAFYIWVDRASKKEQELYYDEYYYPDDEFAERMSVVVWFILSLGYYNDCNGVKWLYVVYKNIVGYASSKYLSK